MPLRNRKDTLAVPRKNSPGNPVEDAEGCSGNLSGTLSGVFCLFPRWGCGPRVLSAGPQRGSTRRTCEDHGGPRSRCLDVSYANTSAVPREAQDLFLRGPPWSSHVLRVKNFDLSARTRSIR